MSSYAKVEIKDGRIEGYLNINETSEKWGVCRATINTWIHRNRIPKSSIISITLGPTGNKAVFIKDDCVCPKLRRAFSYASTSYTQYKLTTIEDKILRMLESDRLPISVVAKEVGKREQTVRTIYYRALAKILKQGKTLERYLSDEEVKA